MKPAIIPQGLKGKAMFDFLVKNEGLIMHAKKSDIKKADSAFSAPMFINEKGNLVDKSALVETQTSPDKIKVVAVINTTNLFDSHYDVHIPGLWKKSISDNKKAGFYLLDSHSRGFEDVIAEGCAANTQAMSWKELNVSLPGATEALIFTGVVDKDRNEFMFNQYMKGYVKQHSVGMRYVKVVTCINDEDYPVQKENWDKYIEMVSNRTDAEDEGFFWAVLEAQVVEGSAVLFASNTTTPCIDVSTYEEDSTQDEPLKSTQIEPVVKSFSDMIKETKFI